MALLLVGVNLNVPLSHVSLLSSYHRSCLLEVVFLHQSSGNVIWSFTPAMLMMNSYFYAVWGSQLCDYGFVASESGASGGRRQYRIYFFSLEEVWWYTESSLDSQAYVDNFCSNLDWVGSFICLGLSTCLVLGLTWGGAVKPWKGFDVLFPLILAGVLIIIFLTWEKRKGSQALVPMSLFKHRTHTGACLEGVSLFPLHVNHELTDRISCGFLQRWLLPLWALCWLLYLWADLHLRT